MIADVSGFIACDYAADRVALPGDLVRETHQRGAVRTVGTR